MRRRAPIISAILLAAVVACGDSYLRTNPYDPAVPVTIMLSGPDTLFSYNERGQYSAQSIPAFPDTAFTYGTVDSNVFFPSGPGGFSSMAPPLYPATRTARVTASLGQIDTILDIQNLQCAGDCRIPATLGLAWRHSTGKDVVLTQKVVRLQLRCPTIHACDTLSAGATWTVWADGLDALSYGVLALNGANANPAVSSANPLFATFVLRDTTLATLTPVGIRVATVAAQKSGTTWIVATRGPLMDSLRLIVR